MRRGPTQRPSEQALPGAPSQSHIDTSKWLVDDFAGIKIKNFDEMRENFIEDLTNQFSDLLVPVGRDRATSVKLKPTSGLEANTTIVHEENGEPGVAQADH